MTERPPETKPAAPRRLGRYEVIGELASGGMGTVYLARHAGEGGFQRLFAIKLMHAHLAEDRVFIDMLRDEARLAARLHHPNVVPIVDLGSEDGRYYVVMEYIDGCSLIALAARHRNDRPPELVAPILIDALEGLHAAHTLCDDEGKALNLVHRDVSPQNILIGTDGVGRITDFGIAKAETRITSTRPGTRKGKLSYMAPEQIKEDGENIDLRADIFAAGAVLWSALTGQPLFRGKSDGATLNNILNKPVAPPSGVGLKPPAVFDAVCLRALERDPEKRFESAIEMADALRAALVSLGTKSSRAQIARWVVSSFANELDERRRSILAAAQRPRPTTDESLPAIPALSGPASLSSPHLGRESEPVLVVPPLAPIPPASSAPPSLSTINASQSVYPMTSVAALRSRLGIFIAMGAAAIAIALILIVWQATRSSESPPISMSSAPAARPTPVAPAASLAPQDVEPTAENIPPTAASALPIAKEPATDTRRTARVTENPRTPPSKKSGTEPSKTPSETPPKASATQPTASPGVKIEKNPYLRHD